MPPIYPPYRSDECGMAFRPVSSLNSQWTTRAESHSVRLDDEPRGNKNATRSPSHVCSTKEFICFGPSTNCSAKPTSAAAGDNRHRLLALIRLHLLSAGSRRRPVCYLARCRFHPATGVPGKPHVREPTHLWAALLSAAKTVVAIHRAHSGRRRGKERSLSPAPRFQLPIGHESHVQNHSPGRERYTASATRRQRMEPVRARRTNKADRGGLVSGRCCRGAAGQWLQRPSSRADNYHTYLIVDVTRALPNDHRNPYFDDHPPSDDLRRVHGVVFTSPLPSAHH